MPRRDQVLLGAWEESKTSKTYEIILLCPGASKLLHLLLLPSSIYLLGDSKSNIFFIFSSILYLVVTLARVLGRTELFFFSPGFNCNRWTCQHAVKSSLDKKTRMQQNTVAIPSLSLTPNMQTPEVHVSAIQHRILDMRNLA